MTVVMTAVVAAVLASCAPVHRPADRAGAGAGEAGALLDTLEVRTFRFFWDLAEPGTMLTPDRAPTKSFASIGATGFALTAYAIGSERGFVPREAAAARVRRTLEFLWSAPQDSMPSGSIGWRGFYYHFLHPATGARFERVELSTMDTALLMAGVLSCQAYFDGGAADEAAIRATAESLFARVDWQWASVRPPSISHGWSPEEGFLPYDWRGYNEAMLVYLLALGSTTHPVTPEAWTEWTSEYRWGAFEGEEHLGFAPLFGHQYTHAWIDLRGIRDTWMAAHGIDYFENSRRAVRAQHAYAVRNPLGWKGYGDSLWGLSACDGPLDGRIDFHGESREVHTYWARGASFTWVNDDGVVSPPAMAASIVFEPERVTRTLLALRHQYGDALFARYGLLGAVSPGITRPLDFHHGAVHGDLGWIATDYLGIDQGALLLMLENRRSGLVWDLMRRSPAVVRGLRAAGFAGGWLDSSTVAR